MIVLTPDFNLIRYGLEVRLVCEKDAQFILDLRTDPDKAKFLKSTDDSLEKQKEWIREYKEREKVGKDYYFFYSYKNFPAGVNRIYGIENGRFIHGSWVFSKMVPPFCSLAAAIIAREIAYDTLGLEEEKDTSGIHVDNVGVLKVSELLGVEFNGKRTSGSDIFLLGTLKKDVFLRNKKNLLKYIPSKYL